jgi:hypothetical protein
MTLTPTEEGLEARFRPRGIGRWFSAAFLSIWLCGWLAGECFAIGMLVLGVGSFLNGAPAPGSPATMPIGVAAVAAHILRLWLSFWTLGGWAAGYHLLQLISSEDRILVRHDALVVRRRIGPFRSTRTVPRAEIDGIHSIARKNRVIADTTGGTIELTMHASGDSVALVAALREALDIGAASDDTFPPKDWREVIDADGRTALVHLEDNRRARGRIAWGLAILVAGLAAAAARNAPADSGALPAACGLAFLALALGWGAWRISNTRREWRIDPGRLSLRRRSARGARDLFEGHSLEFIETSDSDGDRWYTLYAVAAGAPPAQVPPRISDLRLRRKISRSMDDPSEPRRLGAWIARRTGMRLEDRTPAVHTVQLAELLGRLEASGRLGRWLAKRLPTAGRTP